MLSEPKNIQLFRPYFRIQECLDEVEECLEQGWTGLGFKTSQLENLWNKEFGFQHSVFLNSATSGLHLALETLKRTRKWNIGDEVISSPLTFVSANHSIIHAGLTPVFADVDDTLCLSPESVLNAISPKTKCIVYVGLGGNVGNYAAIRDICREKNLALILDAAHMSGSYDNGVQVGLDADVTVFSFQAVKNLGTADAGMACFANSGEDTLAREMSWLGISKDTFARQASSGKYQWKYEVDEVGFKYHGNSVVAALGLVGLKYLKRDNAYRREVANAYFSQLEGVESVIPVGHENEAESSRHLFQILAKDRDDLMQHLSDKGIATGVHYRTNTDYPTYSKQSNRVPKACALSSRLVSLPLHLLLDESDIQRICREIISFYEGR